MIKPLSLVLLCVLAISAQAQTPAAVNLQNRSSVAPTTMPYGVIDIADLKMKACDFEPDANAEMLFDDGDMDVRPLQVSAVRSMKRHVRIKIFNDYGKTYASVKLLYSTEFETRKGFKNIEAETINLDGDKIIKTPVDKSQIYSHEVNKDLSEIVFTMPNVQAGSVIEFKYATYPQSTWYFQGNLPTRLSQVRIRYGDSYYSDMGAEIFIKQPLFKDSTEKKTLAHTFALKNIPSLQNEPLMTARRDNLQRVQFKQTGRFWGTGWRSIAAILADTVKYSLSEEAILPGQEAIINNAYTLNGDAARIAFLFDTIKTIVKWNGELTPVRLHEQKDVWLKKAGNSTEINLLLLHFLRAMDFKALPTLVATKDFGTIKPLEPDLYSANNFVVTIPIDSTKSYYVLDASNKYNLYDEVPLNILNTQGVTVDFEKKKVEFLILAKNTPARQLTSIDASIAKDGKMTGIANVTSGSYHKAELLRLFDKLDQKNYLDSAFHMGNSVKVNLFKIDNVKNDNEPLLQEISFATDPAPSDNYIYINTSLFTRLGDNPFKNEQRFTNIDLLFGSDYGMNGVYKIPEGYKIDALPKSITVIMPDTSMIFRRTVTQDDGSILIRYVISQRRTIYKVEEYQYLRDFYKKMYEMLNEQIVLKKQ